MYTNYFRTDTVLETQFRDEETTIEASTEKAPCFIPTGTKLSS